MLLSRWIQFFLFNSILCLSKTENQFYRLQPHDISALIGSNITIPCVIASPHGDVQWTKDGLALGYDRELEAFPSWSIIGDEKNGEFNFFIQSLKLEDEGLFACEVSPYQDALPLKQIAHIRTLVRPESVRINPPTDLINIRFDETIHQIDCQVDRARPAAHIKWIDETGQEFPATSRTMAQDRLFSTISTLTLVPSLSLHKKRFTCDVQHETLTDKIQSVQTSFEIQITSPPNTPLIHGYTSTSRLINGSYLTLSCQAYAGQPLGRISWFRLDNQQLHLIDNSSEIIVEKNLVENNLSMIIRPSDNNATFFCQVTNDYLQSIEQILQKNMTLYVAFGPTSVSIRDNDVNGTTTFIEGTPRQFICRTSSSNPRAIVTWKLDEQILPPDTNPLEEPGEYGGIIIQSTKTIGLDKPLRYYHEKILSCEAKNSDTGYILTDSTRLNIIYDAKSIEIHGITKDQKIQSGESISAECILTGGNPLGEILWYKGNELLTSESIIDSNRMFISSRVNFTASSSDHNLSLFCKGQVENFPSKSTSMTLNIFFLPEEMMIVDHAILSNLSLDQQNCRVFECRTSISNPQVQLVVYRQSKNGQKYMDIQYKTSTSYIDGINSIQFMLPSIDFSFHENRLICEAILDIESSSLTKQVNYLLYVNHKPYFFDFNSSFEIIENQSLNITLLATAYPLPITYTWFHPTGRQLMNDQLKILINESQLSLFNIQRNDAGIYRCLASNSLGTTEVNFTLNILYGPMIIRTQGYGVTEALISGTSATLSCVIDANPVDLSNVRWLKDQQEISFDQWEKRIEGTEGSLIRKSVQRDDAGEYTCEIENSFGKNRATLPLFIQYAPEIDRTDPNRNKLAIDSDRYLSAEFHCHLSALPKPTITWLKNDQILLNSSKYQLVLNEQSSSSNLLFHTVLTVSNISKTDYGIYQCKVENTLGIDTINFTLIGLTIPDPPREIQVINISHSSALISWTPGFNGGASQTFQIRYRLSTADRYFYEHLPIGIESFDLKNLRLASEYYLNIRSNNSFHLSEWSDELIIRTLNTFPSSSFHSSEFSPTKMSFTIVIIIAILGSMIFLINTILLIIFCLKRRRSHVSSENLSTTETNETEANTVDLFQPIPSNLLLINTYPKYEDEDIKSPFVSSFSSITSLDKKARHSSYDTLRLHHHYHPTNFENNLVTYRSFKVDVTNPCIRAELV